MADFRTTKNFNSSGTATDGYDVFLNRQDGVDIILSKDVNDLADSIVEAQKAMEDGYAVTTLLPQAVSFEDGQTLVYNAGSSTMVAGASGDASFKVQAVTDPNATIKSGFLMLDDGREMRIASDLVISLDTVLGSDPTDATAYYLYVDANSLGSSTTTAEGRVVYDVVEANFSLQTTSPEGINLARYAPIGLIKSADSGTAWSGTGSAFETLAFRRHDLGGAGAVLNPIVYTNSSITSATGHTTFTHGANVATEDQRWSAQIQGTDGYIYQPDDAEWLVDMVDANNIEVDFSFLSSGDTATIKLADEGFASSGTTATLTYDSGSVAANGLSLPLSHGLPGTPTALVLLQEVSAGQWEPLDFGSFMSVSSTQLLGDLSSLGSQQVRILLSMGAEAVLSTFWNSQIATSNVNVFRGDEVFVNTSAPRIITLPSSPSMGDRVRIIDYSGSASSNNITIARAGGENIEGAATDFTIDVDRAGIEAVYSDSSEGWILTDLT